jgi:hypothetical protein
VDASKSYQVGMSVKIAHDSTNWMHGEVTSYNAGTGALVVNVTAIFGSGTETSWTVTLSGPMVAYVMPIRDTARGLVIKNNATNYAYQVDIDADEIIVQDGSGIAKSISAVNLTVDITASGANGLDTGSEENKLYYIWVINNGSTTAGLLSLSSTAPTLPSGYTYTALVGAISNLVGNFLVVHQVGGIVSCEERPIVSAGALPDSATELDLSDYIPANAVKVHFDVSISANSTTQIGMIFWPTTTGSSTNRVVSLSGASGNLALRTPVIMPIVEAQKIYYNKSGNGGTLTLNLVGWEY